MTAADPLPGVTAARLPAAGLAALAAVRAVPGVRVHETDAGVWVTWPTGRSEVARRLIGVAGAEFFVRRGDRWHRFGSRLPTGDAPPEGEGRPLPGVVLPGRFAVTTPPADTPRLSVTLERGGPPRPASALLCAATELQGWADTALTDELATVSAARCGSRVLLLGDRLPAVLGGTRLWGVDVLLPLGFRPSPDVPLAALRAAAGVAVGELLLLTPGRAEAVPRAAFAPATRAGLRLAGGG